MKRDRIIASNYRAEGAEGRRALWVHRAVLSEIFMALK